MKLIREIEGKRGNESWSAQGAMLYYDFTLSEGPTVIGRIDELLRDGRIEMNPELAAYMGTPEYLDSMAVCVAIEILESIDPQYWDQTLTSRLSGGTGSRTRFETTAGLQAALMTAVWESYEHPAISPECLGYRTEQVRGHVGVQAIQNTDWVRYESKGGIVYATIVSTSMPAVNHTVAIVGPDGDLWTFHPGDPIRPSQNTDQTLVGVTEQGWKAKEKGFVNAKVVDR